MVDMANTGRSAKTNQTSAPTRQAVVVLAMHRTGSSALTRVLNLLGCDAAKTLMSADGHNESGYWESNVLRVFNDQLLASGGSDWRDWQAFNPGWYQTPRLEEYLNRGRDLLNAEYGASPFFVFKDPRVTRIMPFWCQLLASVGVQAHVIMTLRHPAEVFASLAKRDGMTSAEGALIWLRNVLEAEHDSRGMPRGVVSYDQLIAAPSKTMMAIQSDIGLIWPGASGKVIEEINDFMSPDLRHHKQDSVAGLTKDQPFRDWLDTVYGIFARWSESGEDQADFAALDAVRTAMNDLAAPLREVVGTLSRQSTEMVKMQEELRYLRGEAGKRGERITALTAENDTLTKERDAARQEKQQVIEKQQAELDDVRAALAKERSDLQAMRSEHETALQSALSDADVLRGERIAALTAENDALTKEQDAARQEAADKELRLTALEEELAMRRKSEEELQAVLNEVQEARESERDDIASMRNAHDEQLRAALSEADVLRGELESLTEKLSVAEADKQKLFEEIGSLTEFSLLQDEKLSNEADRYTQQQNVYQAQIAELNTDLQAAETALAEAQDAQTHLKDVLAQTQSALSQRQLETEETAAELKAARRDQLAAQTKLERLREEHAAGKSALVVAQEALEAVQKTHVETQGALEATKRKAQTSESARYSEIAELTQTLMKREAVIAEQEAHVQAANAVCNSLNAVVEQQKQELTQSEGKIAQLTQDIAAHEETAANLTLELEQRGAAVSGLMGVSAEGRALAGRIGDTIDALLHQAERPWLTRKYQLARKKALLQDSGLFDAEWYAEAYPDIAEAGQDPAIHFILFGREEGRYPLPGLARLLGGDQKTEPPVSDD